LGHGTLVATMKLSRLVLDNAYTPEFASRIVDYEDGQQQIIPQGIHFLDLLPAYRLPETRDRLTETVKRSIWLHGQPTSSRPMSHQPGVFERCPTKAARRSMFEPVSFGASVL